MGDELGGKHGVQSMEVGIAVLQALVLGQGAMMLKEIAAAAGMPASKVHRYLVSMVRTGLVEQDPVSSRYDLGPFALNIGLVALDRLDRVRLGVAGIAALRDEVNETTALSVWSENGPIIVRGERPRRPITVNVVTGTALDLLSSASGRVFAAWLPESTVASMIAKELKAPGLPSGLRNRKAVEAMLETVRRDGYSAVSGYHLVPGVEAVAAPVFDHPGRIALVMLVVGVQGMFDTAPQGRVVTALKAAAAALSARLGGDTVRRS